ncbi:MAG TPA: transposase [Povalibacter sp.]|nr:transposase [Povalibacter sp.]
MPRRARIAIARYPHHIVQRGHNHRAVFLTDEDRRIYLETLQEFRRELALKVYGYCLMTNHVHLIVEPGAEAADIGRLMKRLAGTDESIGIDAQLAEALYESNLTL